MKAGAPWKYLPPPGPLLGLLLIGFVLLSGLLYYRAVTVQRFLEPALALSQPQNEFSKNITRIFRREFGPEALPGLTLASNSILMEKALLVSGEGRLASSAQTDLRKLARIFLALMKDEHAKSEISLVLIIGRIPSHGVHGTDVVEWAKAGRMVGFIQDELFRLEPDLGRRYATSFASVVLPANSYEAGEDFVEFRIMPSEFLHVEVLEKLEKYYH